MKFIVYGYKDQHGVGPGKAIAGEGVTTNDDAEQIMEAARTRNIRPSGYQRLEFCAVNDPQEIHAFISDEVDAIVRTGHEKLLAAQASERAAINSERDKLKLIAVVNELFYAAAGARNKAIAAVAAQRNLLVAETLSPDAKPDIMAKIEKLEPVAAAAVKAFDVVLAARNVVKNPKSTPEAVNQALIDLKLKPSTTN